MRAENGKMVFEAGDEFRLVFKYKNVETYADIDFTESDGKTSATVNIFRGDLRAQKITNRVVTMQVHGIRLLPLENSLVNEITKMLTSHNIDEVNIIEEHDKLDFNPRTFIYL